MVENDEEDRDSSQAVDFGAVRESREERCRRGRIAGQKGYPMVSTILPCSLMLPPGASTTRLPFSSFVTTS